MSDWRANTKAFFGWYLVAAMFVVIFNTGGMGFYVFPVFITPLKQEFGWTQTQIAGSAAIWAIVFGLSSPLVGILISRFGAMKTMLAAAAIASLTNLGFAALKNLPMLYAISFVAGFVVAGTTLVPAQTLVTNWFDRYRGRAMALVMIGIGFGGFLLPPFNEYMIRVWGWRMTWVFATVVLWALIIPVIAIFVRTRPADLGLRVDGEKPEEATGERSAHVIKGMPVKSAVMTSAFWLLVGIYILQLLGLSAMNFHFVTFAEEQANFTRPQAAWFYGLAVGFSIGGRLLFGWLADRFKPALLAALAGLLLACGPAVLELFIIRMGLRDVNLLWLYAAPFGIGIGANAIILPVLVGRCFGELNFAKIMGLVMSGFAIGIIIGIPVAGHIFDKTGSFELVFIFCVAGLIVSALLALFLRPERYHQDFATEEVSAK